MTALCIHCGREGCPDPCWQGLCVTVSDKLGQEAHHVVNVPARAEQDQGSRDRDPQGLFGCPPAGGLDQFHNKAITI